MTTSPMVEAPVCVACGYDLRGQVERRCPECGTPFDPKLRPVPAIPWMQLELRNRWLGYWRTLAWVLHQPRSAAAIISSTHTYLTASGDHYRQLLIIQAVCCAGASACLLMLRLVGDLAVLGPGILVAITTVPGTSLFFWAVLQPHSIRAWRVDHEPRSGRNAEALLVYTSAPLALLPAVPLTQLIALLLGVAHQPELARAADLLAVGFFAGIALVWWTYTLVMMSAAQIWTRIELVRASILIPLRWALLAVAALAVTMIMGMCIFLPIALISGG